MNRFVAIDIGQLRIGMYVHLEMGWLSHPFPVNSFKITTVEQLQNLKSLRLKQIQYDPERSDPELSEPQPQVGEKPPALSPAGISAPKSESDHRTAAWRASVQAVQARFQASVSRFEFVHSLVPANLPAARSRSDELVGEYVVQLAQDSDVSLHLLFDEAGGSASAHGVNTAVLALLLGKTLGMQGQLLHDLGVAALLHDLGKLPLNIQASACVFNQKLLDAAQAPSLYARHVGESVALAQSMGFAPSVTTAIAQHHEWADGSGFPLGLLAADMELGGQILALINNYDRLCNPGASMTAQTPHEALASLFGQYRQRYAPEVLRAFVQTLGVYPPGSWVELSDGSQGMVVSVNTQQALKPSVLVYKPLGGQGGQGSQQLVELAQQTELGIRRGLHKEQVQQKALAALQPNRHLCYFFDSSAATAAEKAAS